MDDVGSRVMFFGSFLDMLATRGRTAGARWRHDGPRMGHDSAKVGHDSGKMGILSSTWELLGQFWEQFSRILGDGRESEKHSKSIGFLWFLAPWKRCLSILGAVLDDVGSRVVFFRKLFGHVGTKLANKRANLVT